jgi:hypothetical protein
LRNVPVSADPQLREKRRLLILDELPCAAAPDPPIMEALLSEQSPLFGHITGQRDLEPWPFSSLVEFFLRWDASERFAAYTFNGKTPDILLEECKWDKDTVGREIVLDLIESKTPLLLKVIWDSKRDWNVY